jgi:hypothetical protein
MSTFTFQPGTAPWRWLFRRARGRLTHRTIAAPLARPVLLQRGATLMIEEPRELDVHCLAGCVWLTVDNDPRDIVLRAYERITIDRNGRLMIQALRDAKVRVTCERYS